MRFNLNLLIVSSMLTASTTYGQITRQECTDQGGTIVGDIGNGAIFQPDFVCDDGTPPSDVVIASPGEPIASEGEVCCGGTGGGIPSVEPVQIGGGLPLAGTQCVSDDDCDTLAIDPEYCSQGICRPSGYCNTIIDCFNPSNNYPDIMCIGQVTCTNNMCGRICDGSDTPSDCPPGLDQVQCFVAPCSNDPSPSCFDEPTTPVSCRDNYCGGCNAIRFDAAGNHICKDESAFPGNTNSNGMQPIDSAAGDEIPGITVQECEEEYDGVVIEMLGEGGMNPAGLFKCAGSNHPPLGYIMEDTTTVSSSMTRASTLADGIDTSACGSPTDACMNENNYAECIALAEAGCTQFLIMESCPLQFGCEAYGDLPLIPASTTSVCCSKDTNMGDNGLPLPPTNGRDRQEMTRDECTDEFGGIIVGDIGDGSIFGDDYVCDSDELPPMGNIVQTSEPPIAIEGEVCCGTVDTADVPPSDGSSGWIMGVSSTMKMMIGIVSLLLAVII